MKESEWDVIDDFGEVEARNTVKKTEAKNTGKKTEVKNAGKKTAVKNAGKKTEAKNTAKKTEVKNAGKKAAVKNNVRKVEEKKKLSDDFDVIDDFEDLDAPEENVPKKTEAIQPKGNPVQPQGQQNAQNQQVQQNPQNQQNQQGQFIAPIVQPMTPQALLAVPPKHLNPDLWAALYHFESVYDAFHNNVVIAAADVVSSRALCVNALEERMLTLEAEGKTAETEYDECVFVRNALQNGWLPSDVRMLIGMYEAVHHLPEGSAKGKGMDTLSLFTSGRADTVERRYDILDAAVNYFITMNGNEMEAVYNAVNTVISNPVQYTEMPNDEKFQHNAYGIDLRLKSLRVKAEFTGPRRERLKQVEKEKNDYIMETLTEEDMEKFAPHKGHKHNKIKKSNRKALKEVYGEEIYDDIDEMHKGSMEERRVKLYHAYGTRLMKEGKEVLELDFAGSGFQDVAHAHKGRNGIVYQNREEVMEQNYGGARVEKKGGGKFRFIRAENKPVKTNDGKTLTKTRYSIAGPTPTLWLFPGTFNLGDYSIESTKVYARDFAQKFLEPHFRAWEAGTEVPHDLHLVITGHSRGAVAAGQSVKLINKYVQKYAKAYAKKNNKHLEFAKYVHYDVTLREPVPGVVTNIHLASCNLKDIPNVNTTIICSMAQEHGDFLYPLQHVKGAKKLIIGTAEHTNMKETDSSQMHLMDDHNAHQAGFYDAETGEMYRGSGLSQLPDGVYFQDEKNNLIRVTSYSQLGKVIDAVYDGQGKQSTRVKNIHKMTRDWFLENHLEMSFADEEARTEETAKYTNVEDRILDSRKTRLKPVKEAILELKKVKAKENVSRTDILAAEDMLITACREYMRKTVIPTEGDSAYRMNLVSDALSFTMRERNYQMKALEKENGIEIEHDLDNRIYAHKERLAKKNGSLERKLEKEERRLKNEESIQTMVKDTAMWCRESLAILDTTRVGKITSDEYDAFHEMLSDGAKMGDKTSVADFEDFLKKMTKISDTYTLYHDSPLGPLTKDGRTRLKISKDWNEYAKQTGLELNQKTAYMADKEMPIGYKVESRRKSVENLQTQTEAKKAMETQKKAKLQEEAKKKLEERKKAQAKVKPGPVMA